MSDPSHPAIAHKGDLVQIHIVVLQPGERAANLPDATRAVPYEGWIKGFLVEDSAVIGQTVRISSLIGREIIGVLSDINPVYNHNFGEPQPTLDKIGVESWARLEEAAQ